MIFFKVKLKEAEMENIFLRREVKDLKVLLNAKIQIPSHNFKTYTENCFLQENSNAEIDSLPNFQISSPKANILKNLNNFSNKNNSFFLKIINDVGSSIYSSHNNSKTLESFNKSSVADFT